jgi:DNA uptake protein ComE-like DNA-binding protein
MRNAALLSLAAATLLAACSETEDGAPAIESSAPAQTAAAGTATAPVLDANTATEAQLGGVAGLTPDLAAKIVAGRPYADVTALDAKLRESLPADAAKALLERVFVPVNLNSASEKAIKLIPGMSDKMVHEFLEYRPYENMAEFDREIGKYVDEAEVARLRGYVTL